MSIAALTAVFRRTYGNPTRKLLMAALADFADEHGRAWPSIDTLAARAECSRRSVQDHLAALVTEGHLEILRNAGPSGTHLYRLIFKKSAPAPTAQEGGAESARGVQISGGDLHGGGANQRRYSAPEPSVPVMNRQEGEEAPAPPPASPIVESLRETFPDAPRDITGRQHADMTAHQPVLAEMTADDWLALRAWLAAPLRIRGRKTAWPRDRAEFLANAGEVLETVREWWRKKGGRRWWQDHRAAPKPPPLPPPAGDTSLHDTIEDPAEALAFFRNA